MFSGPWYPLWFISILRSLVSLTSLAPPLLSLFLPLCFLEILSASFFLPYCVLFLPSWGPWYPFLRGSLFSSFVLLNPPFVGLWYPSLLGILWVLPAGPSSLPPVSVLYGSFSHGRHVHWGPWVLVVLRWCWRCWGGGDAVLAASQLTAPRRAVDILSLPQTLPDYRTLFYNFLTLK